jgi:hypothetical protein
MLTEISQAQKATHLGAISPLLGVRHQSCPATKGRCPPCEDRSEVSLGEGKSHLETTEHTHLAGLTQKHWEFLQHQTPQLSDPSCFHGLPLPAAAQIGGRLAASLAPAGLKLALHPPAHLPSTHSSIYLPSVQPPSIHSSTIHPPTHHSSICLPFIYSPPCIHPAIYPSIIHPIWHIYPTPPTTHHLPSDPPQVHELSKFSLALLWFWGHNME